MVKQYDQYSFGKLFSSQTTYTTLNADWIVDERRVAIVWEANVWICFLASENRQRTFQDKETNKA